MAYMTKNKAKLTPLVGGVQSVKAIRYIRMLLA